MLTSLVINLVPEQVVSLPLHLGRANHAAFLRLVSRAEPSLGAQLHEPNQERPFTCSSLWGARRVGQSLQLTPDKAVSVRFTALTAQLSAILQEVADSPPSHLDYDGTPLLIQRATVDSAADPWAGQVSYEALAARYLLPGEPGVPHAELSFASPTAFRSGGHTLPVPLPHLVYGGLVHKWNTFAPVAVSDDMRRYAKECLAMSRYKLSTRALPAKGRPAQIGCVGWCRYVATNRDRYWLGVFQMLTDFAFFAGVGYQTAVGMGQVRRRVLQTEH